MVKISVVYLTYQTNQKQSIMMIREFRILATGQTWDGFYLADGSGDIQCKTNKGEEIFYDWEFELLS